MGTTLAILMVLGIFIGIPAVIGFAIAGMFVLKDRRVRATKSTKALEESGAEVISKQEAKVRRKATIRR